MRTLSKDFKGQRPLLIQPAQAEAYLSRVSGMDMSMDAKISDMGEMLSAIFGQKPSLKKFPPFAVIPIKGIIGRDVSMLESLCGCCDINDVEEMLEDCERDASIKTIILEIDSPGGTSVGVPELANRIKNCSKEVISFTSSECCSAAYWLGSQASSFYATPSSSIGSVGVYIAYPECSEAYKMEGVKLDVIKAGIYKGAGISGTSLDDNQRKMLQDEVLDIWADFKAAVKSVRSFVEDSSMEGQMFSGKRGAEAGLCTALVNGFDELMESLDAGVAKQIEADEENEENENEGSLPEGYEGEEGDEDDNDRHMASSRALAGVKADVLKAVAAKKPMDKAEAEADDEGDEEPEEKGEGEDDGIEPQPEGKGDPSDPDDPDYDPDNDPNLKESKEDAESEDDAGEKAVDTDSKHDPKGVKKNRAKRIA